MPVAVTAPEYMEQKATIDAFGAVAFGLYTHVSPVPPVTGSAAVVKLLTETVEFLNIFSPVIFRISGSGQAAYGNSRIVNRRQAGRG
ncbi:MAG: hypothetical protein STSR0004_13820 [Peptococcaceae bacterium]